MSRMDNLMQMVAICEKFGWTYEEYQSQPFYFITVIKRKMAIDQKRQELNQKQIKHG